MKDPVLENCADFAVTIHEHISEIPSDEWDTLVSNTMFHTHTWIAFMEYSVREDVTPYYVTVRRGVHLVGGVVCYVTSKRIYKVPIKCIACAYPFSYESTLFVKKGEDPFTVLSLLCAALERIAQKTKAHAIIITYPGKDFSLFFEGQGFSLLKQIPAAYLYIQWKTFKEYLKSLPRKTRKNIRHTLNQGKREGLVLEHSQDFSGLDHLFSLYMENLERHNYEPLVPFTQDLYRNIEKHIHEYTFVVRCYLRDDLLGYWIYFFDGTFATMTFSGMNVTLASEYDAYFNICYDAIREMIDRGCKKVLFGASTYRVKRRIGCTIEITMSSIKFMNPFLNFAAKVLVFVQNFLIEYRYRGEVVVSHELVK
ncbi:MAG: GNAT family N-acetyltransferase [Theionarchaea archaeon]|nr:GNAT family N-acetyltransferase [Theionarchaea archaeon]